MSHFDGSSEGGGLVWLASHASAAMLPCMIYLISISRLLGKLGSLPLSRAAVWEVEKPHMSIVTLRSQTQEVVDVVAARPCPRHDLVREKSLVKV